MSELLATYTDIVLRKGSKAQIDASGDNEDLILPKIVQLFMHLVDKDIFIEVFKSYLAKRLLNEKSRSIESEQSIISQLKLSCGVQFTKKVEGMITDLNWAN